MNILASANVAVMKAYDVLTAGGGSGGGGPVIPDGASVEDIIEEGGTAFEVVQTFFSVIGVFIVITTLWKVIKSFVGAKPGDAAKSFLYGLVAAIFCFNIDLPLQLVDGLGGVFEGVFEGIQNLIG